MSSAEGVTARWKQLAHLSDLTAERRLATKIPMSPEAVTRRLRQIEELRRACLAFGRAKRLPEEGEAAVVRERTRRPPPRRLRPSR